MRHAHVLLSHSLAIILGLSNAQAQDAATEIPTALQEYVAAKDGAFAWKIRATDQRNGCLVYEIDLTSQVWQGITWKHAMSAFVPDDVRHTDTVLLFITGGRNGGRPRDEDLAMGTKLAALAQMPVAF
ncbi:MAG TPA: PhoPQ-activated protein PqaA family protein, partial [Lacipirellulaceae bacterium]